MARSRSEERQREGRAGEQVGEERERGGEMVLLSTREQAASGAGRHGARRRASAAWARAAQWRRRREGRMTGVALPSWF